MTAPLPLSRASRNNDGIGCFPQARIDYGDPLTLFLGLLSLAGAPTVKHQDDVESFSALIGNELLHQPITFWLEQPTETPFRADKVITVDN